jgi:hypothetical protein
MRIVGNHQQGVAASKCLELEHKCFQHSRPSDLDYSRGACVQ